MTQKAERISVFNKDGFRRTKRLYGAVLGLAWEAARSRVAGVMIIAGLLGVTSGFGAYMVKKIVDSIQAGRSSQTWLFAGLYLGQFSLTVILNHLSQLLSFDMGDRIMQQVDGRLMEISIHAAGLDHLERPEFADKIKLVRTHVYVPQGILHQATWLVSIVVGLTIAVILLGQIHWALTLMPVIALPASMIQFRVHRNHFRRWDDIAPEDRQAQHLLELATEPKSAKEVRLFDLGPLLKSRHKQLTSAYIASLFRDRLKRTGWGIITGGADGVMLAVAIGFIGWLALNRRATLGDVAMGVQMTRSLMGQVQSASDSISWLAELTFVGERFLWLLDYEPDVKVLPADQATPAPDAIRKGITFEDVSFTYPGTAKEVLHGVSFVIPAGGTVALVGENGAGKSSLVKLLSRFYDPTGGRILIDDIDLKDIDLEGWRNHVGAAFQDFVRFQLVAQESVGIGELSAIDDRPKVEAAARQSGADRTIERLPRSYDTQLGREFADGTDLSEGEWQRVALARGSMRTQPILFMMDEPTASLDARSEHDVFARLSDLSKSKDGRHPAITVLVSHRFSTVRMADLIVVLHNGRIEEIGTHESLLAKGGRYSELFGLQASRYD